MLALTVLVQISPGSSIPQHFWLEVESSFCQPKKQSGKLATKLDIHKIAGVQDKHIVSCSPQIKQKLPLSVLATRAKVIIKKSIIGTPG